jgi:transporter family protein
MSWLLWALLSAFFAGVTAILAKVGVQGVDSNLATALRTVVILVFAWAVALATKTPNDRIGWEACLAIPDTFRRCDRFVLDLLLPRAPARRSVARGSYRQAERCGRNRPGGDFPS